MWAVQNGERIDARIALDVNEWWVVVSVAGPTVKVDAIEERPRPFAGIAGGVVVVLNGPSSAGKSSVMRALVEVAPDPWVALDELFFGHVRLGFAIWPEVAPTLRSGFLSGIGALAAAGNLVLMTSGGDALEDILDATNATQLFAVGLMCPTEVLAARHAERKDRWGGLLEDTLDAHDGWTYDLSFDTSRMSATEIADGILAAVGRRSV